MAVKKRVLIVDDDYITCKILRDFLSSRNADVIVANSATEAGKYLNNYHFDLLITDINMPEVNGIELLMWTKAKHPETDIIVITGQKNEQLKELSEKNLVLYSFAKPVNLKHLDLIIKKLKNPGFEGKAEQDSSNSEWC